MANDELPEAIQDAKRLQRKFFYLLGVASVGWVPLAVLDANALLDFRYSVWALIGLCAVWAARFDWRKYGKAEALLKAYGEQEAQREVQQALMGTNPPELDTDDPFHAIATRLRELAVGDAAILSLVDDLLVQMDKAEQDLNSLKAAIDAEVDLGAADDEPRLQRLKTVASSKQSVMDQLAGALRDLHVELTVRQDDDHSALIAQVRDALDNITAQTEVEQMWSAPAVSTADTTPSEADAKRTAQRREAEKERQ